MGRMSNTFDPVINTFAEYVADGEMEITLATDLVLQIGEAAEWDWEGHLDGHDATAPLNTRLTQRYQLVRDLIAKRAERWVAYQST